MLRKCGRIPPEQAAEMQRLANQAAVGQFCAALRALGWSHQDAASHLGIARETVWRWANGFSRIPADAVISVRSLAFGSDSIRPLERTGT